MQTLSALYTSTTHASNRHDVSSSFLPLAREAEDNQTGRMAEIRHRPGWYACKLSRNHIPETGIISHILLNTLITESVSDHMYRMSLLTMFAPPALASRLNIPHCTKMALVHDMAESLVGDITPVDGVSKPEKNRREAATMDYLTTALLGNVHGGLVGSQIRDIWEEYEESETLEAKFVHDIDKMELLLQMMEYERAYKGEVDLGEFTYVSRNVLLPEVRAWCEEVLEERKAYWAGLMKPTNMEDEDYGNGET
jgi:5'-deoxynucleotidase YfbR-like HD superfamily hydrolase